MAVEPIFPRCRPVEAAQNIHERAFAGATRADQCDQLTSLDF